MAAARALGVAVRVAMLAALLPACATLAEGAGGDENLPNAAAGPFREVRSAELGNQRPAPNGLENGDIFPRDVAVLDVDGDPATLAVLAWAAVNIAPDGEEASFDAPANAIVRYGALDGRSFDRTPVPVLEAEGPGDFVASPAVLRHGAEVLLWFDTPQGIALAAAADTESFTRADVPVLAAADSGWDAGATPRHPGVVRLDDGSLRMFYEVDLGTGTAIGEAASSDGRSWSRVGSAPALAPRAPAAEGAAQRWDDAAVGAPSPLLDGDETGRTVLRVYHSATDHEGVQVVALAARYGDDGPLQRAEGPVFGALGGMAPHEPCVVRFDGFTILYATQRASSSDAEAHPAVAIGVAPATITLPTPVP
ncbi:MAG: hypothetical protein WKG00_25740 [Polyangiaceae bacterium]